MNDANSPNWVWVARLHGSTPLVIEKEVPLAKLPPGASLSEHVWDQGDIIIREMKD
jgi:hypothetical protein